MSERLLLTHGCSLSNLPLFVAAAAGLFSDEGLAVEAPPLHTMSSTAELLASGAAELGTAAFTQPLIDSVRPNPPVLVAGSGLRGVTVLARPGINGVAELAGRVVGTFRGDPLEVLLHDALAAAALTFASVDLRYLDDIADAIAAFGAGSLDAITLAEPHATRARALGGIVLSDGRELWGEEFPDTVLVASAALVRERPHVVSAAIRAMLRAEALILEDLEAAVVMAAPHFPGFAHDELLEGARRQPPCIDVRRFRPTILGRWPSLQSLGLAPAGLPAPTSALRFDLLDAEIGSVAAHDTSALSLPARSAP